MVNAVIGGVLIGLAAVVFYLGIGRIAGISGITASALQRSASAKASIAFLLGLMISGVCTAMWQGVVPVRNITELVIPLLLIGGLLVGFGTRLGSGCTSGHGVCGMARLSLRSLVATLVFLGVGMMIATALRPELLAILGRGQG
jgi:uncharacterized membrane protein YedE/YeeE